MEKPKNVVRFQVEHFADAERVAAGLEEAGFEPVRIFPPGPDAEDARSEWITEQMARRFGYRQGMPGLVLRELLRVGARADRGGHWLLGDVSAAIAKRLATTPSQVEAAVFVLLHATAEERAERGYALTGINADFPGADVRHLLAIAESISPRVDEGCECAEGIEHDQECPLSRHYDAGAVQ